MSFLSGPSAPEAPDPYETAQAQSASNRDTAITQAYLNAGTQINPWGSVTNQQTGSSSFTDSDGNTVTVPNFTQTTKLTPAQQAIFNANQGAQTNLANLAQQQSGFLKDYLAKPFSYTNKDAENWAFDLASQRITPQIQQRQEALETQLANQGIAPGSRAWEVAMTQNSNAATDQYNQLALNGRQQGFNEAMATRNQPLNEIASLLSGTQITNPGTQSQAMPVTQVGGTDVAGIINGGYQNQLAASQQGGSTLGGLFGLGTSLIGAGGMAGGFGKLF